MSLVITIVISVWLVFNLAVWWLRLMDKDIAKIKIVSIEDATMGDLLATAALSPAILAEKGLEAFVNALVWLIESSRVEQFLKWKPFANKESKRKVEAFYPQAPQRSNGHRLIRDKGNGLFYNLEEVCVGGYYISDYHNQLVWIDLEDAELISLLKIRIDVTLPGLALWEMHRGTIVEVKYMDANGAYMVKRPTDGMGYTVYRREAEVHEYCVGSRQEKDYAR